VVVELLRLEGDSDTNTVLKKCCVTECQSCNE
jgi:hypothetical protein